MPSRRKKLLNERMKALRELRYSKRKNDKLEKDTLEDEINDVKTKIKLCDSDLAGVFKNNIAITNKRENLINHLKFLEDESKLLIIK